MDTRELIFENKVFKIEKGADYFYSEWLGTVLLSEFMESMETGPFNIRHFLL